MNTFYLEKNRKGIDEFWESDVRRWLIEKKNIPMPTKQEIDNYDNILNSGTSLEDIQSFCQLTGWKWGNIV